MLSSEHPVVGTSDQCCIPLSQSMIYDSDATRVAMDSEMVVKVTAAMEMNHFTVEITNLINMTTGHCADNDVKDSMIR